MAGIVVSGPNGPPRRTNQMRSAIATTISGVTKIRNKSAMKRIVHGPCVSERDARERSENGRDDRGAFKP